MKADPLASISDYPALRQIQDALWGAGQVRGAAVMVGAGVSLAAVRAAEDTQRPPLWSNFSAAMRERLHELDPSRDPLKLADEYEAALGRHALDALIRDLVRDAHWRPGPLHERLLGLPWADVLTTNWDTLLERTQPKDPDRAYEVVRVPADIARTRAPRIVKLHGSMPSHTPFIFTGEDFRTYPVKFAPFVNLAQQVLLENELCLIGFSGDDPNFLQWSGWVRDQLGASARRIRLVGVLDLTPSRRKVLEQHNVTPIDLAGAVEDVPESDRHATAIELFLDSLAAAKPRAPHVWTQVERKEEDFAGKDAVAALTDIVEVWRSDRLSYPGWAVAPPSERTSLRYRTDRLYRILRREYDKASDARIKAAAIAELAWRYDVAFWPLDDWLFQAVGSTAAELDNELSVETRRHLHLVRCRSARARRDVAAVEESLTALEVVNAEPGVVAYERALWARDHLDLRRLAELVDKVVGDDPLWRLRRASLLALLHRDKDAALEIKMALADIHARRAQDPRSVWLLSREAWVAFLMRSAAWVLRDSEDREDDDEEAPRAKYQAVGCEPWDEFYQFDADLNEQLKRQLERESNSALRFDPGVYTRQPPSTWITSHVVSPPLEQLLALAERVGLPEKLGMMGILSGRLSRGLESAASIEPAQVWRSAVFLSEYDKGLIDRAFNRVAVASMPADLVTVVLQAVKSSVDYALAQLGSDDATFDWVGDLRVRLELASRLVVRCEPDAAKQMFRWACEIAATERLDHWHAFEALGHLLKRCLSAVPPGQRSEIALDALEMALPGERAIKGLERDWPEIASQMAPANFVRPSGNARWTLRVSQLLAAARSAQELTRSRAIWRLYKLLQADVLTPEEMRSFASAIWSQLGPEGLPANTSLYPFVFLLLPEETPGKALNNFHAAIASNLTPGKLTESVLHSLRGAAQEGLYRLSLNEALAALEAMLAWRPSRGPADPFGRTQYIEREKREAIGACAAYAALPVLAEGDLTEDLVKQLSKKIVEAEPSPWLKAAAQFVRLVPAKQESVVSALRRGIASSSEAALMHAVEGVIGFLDREAFPKGPPRVLVTDVVGACAIRRDPGINWLLDCVLKLHEAGQLTEEDRSQIIHALEFLFTETAYENWNLSDARTTSLSLIRRDCHRLAAKLLSSALDNEVIQAWVAAGKIDPLPEVRFATVELEEDK